MADGKDDTNRQTASTERFITETGPAAEIAAAIEPVLEHMGFRLVRVAISAKDGNTLQIMTERPDGTISADDCEEISHELSPVLDVLDPLVSAYRLEISSPGIDRPLVRPSDFEDWAGYEARIELKAPLAGRKRFRGPLDGFADGEVRIEVEVPDETGKISPQVIGIAIEHVGSARLIMTDDLIRESLRRSKAHFEAHGGAAGEPGAFDGADIDELPEDVAVSGRRAPKPKVEKPKPVSQQAVRRDEDATGEAKPRKSKPKPAARDENRPVTDDDILEPRSHGRHPPTKMANPRRRDRKARRDSDGD